MARAKRQPFKIDQRVLYEGPVRDVGTVKHYEKGRYTLDTTLLGEVVAEEEELQPLPDDATLVNAARRLFEEEGTIEVDAKADVSRGDDDGAYVHAWVWVSFNDVKDEDKEQK